jgi:hypothetical protein
MDGKKLRDGKTSTSQNDWKYSQHFFTMKGMKKREKIFMFFMLFMVINNKVSLVNDIVFDI